MAGMASVAVTAEGAARPGLLARVRLRRAPERAATSPPGPEATPQPVDVEDLEPSVYRFVIKYSLRRQIALLLLTLTSFPFLYVSLSLPKTIINQAIRESAKFPQAILGIQFDRVPYLMVLCAAFLGLVVINGAFKYYINTFKGQLGERMLRRFRYQLYQRLLHFQLSHFSRASSAQLIPMITAECEPLGGFIGEAFVTPALQGGTLLTLIFFMFMQDWVLGLAAIALYPVQAYVIPKLQRKVNQLGRRRVRTVRQVADRVQESASGLADILANDTAKLQLASFANLLGTIYDIR